MVGNKTKSPPILTFFASNCFFVFLLSFFLLEMLSLLVLTMSGQREFANMLPMVCSDALAMLFMFDLSRKNTLNSVKEWYRQARGLNKVSQLHNTGGFRRGYNC